MNGLLAVLGPIASLAPLAVYPALALFTRLSLVVFLMPGLGAIGIPVRIRLGAALALTFLIFPTVAPFYQDAGADWIPVFFGEAFAGFVLGFSVRIFLFVLTIVGTIIAQTMSLSQIFGASLSEEPNTTVATLLSLTGGVLFLSLDLHVATVGLLIDSFSAMPPGSVFGDDRVVFTAQRALSDCARMFALAVSLSLPFLVLNFAYNLFLGVMNRAMPQLMVTFVGMPAMTFVGLTLLVAGSGGLMLIWLREVGRFFVEASG